MVTLTTVWVAASDGNQKSVTDTNNPGESDADCEIRHLNYIRALLKTPSMKPEVGTTISTTRSVAGWSQHPIRTQVATPTDTYVDMHCDECEEVWGL